MRWIHVLGFSMLLSACGSRGPLYLPGDEPAKAKSDGVVLEEIEEQAEEESVGVQIEQPVLRPTTKSKPL